MLVSVFSCLGVSASAAGNAKKIFTVESSLKSNKLTYTVYVNKGVKLSAAIIFAEYDKSVLEIDEANTGAYMTTDIYGEECENISGLYEADFVDDYDNRYSIAHMASNPTVDYNTGSSRKAYMQFTFKVIDDSKPGADVNFYCKDFNSNSQPENNIPGSEAPQEIALMKTATLGKVSLESVASEKDGVRIKWKKVTGADYYRIYKNNELYAETTDSSVLDYLDIDVKNNVSYTYAVRAVNEASDEGYAAARSDSLSTRYMTAPTNLTLTNDDGKVVVKWEKVEGATAYRVYRRTVDADGDVSTWKYFDKITATSYSDKTAKSGTTYQYAVRVYSDGGNSDLYAEKEILFLDIPEFSIEATVKGVKIAWDKVSGAEEYIIYRKVSDGSWKAIDTVSSSKTSYTDTAASSGKTNSYKIVAVNGSYKSDYETNKLYYLKTPTVSVKNTSSGARVSWKKVSGASSYEIYRKAGSAKSWTKIKTTKSDAYTDTNVKSGTTYKYTIRAVNSKGKSKYGSTAYETIRFLSAPKLQKITSTKSGVTVYWDDVKGASKYHIYRKTGSGDYELIKTVSGGSTVKYLDKTAKKGKTYTYKVYAGYSSYQSSYKSTLTIKDKY